jgi:hypothetical protein
MTAFTIQQMVEKVGLRIGLNITSAPIGSSDLKIKQLLELFNEEVDELGTLYRWSALTEEATFVSVATEDQGAFIGDILAASAQFNYIVSDTMWDRTAAHAILGPETSLDWQARKALSYTAGPFPNYRVRANRLLMLPVPTAGHTIAFEYGTKKHVYNPGADTYGDTFSENESVPVLDSAIIMAGVRWRWKMAKGFQYAEEKRTYEQRAATASGRDFGRKTLNLGGGNQASHRGGDITTTAL